MAVQKGIMPFSGKVGELVGFSRNGEMFSRGVPGAYDLTEESKKSGKEFGRGSSASAQVRKAFDPLILTRFKTDLHNRLSERFREVIRSGPLSEKGYREVADGDVSLLKGFELSSYSRFHKLVSFSPVVSVSGTSVSVTIPHFDWKHGLNGPGNATQAVFGLACGFFDFENGISQRLLSGDLVIEKNTPFAGAALDVPVPESPDQVVLVMMTVFFADGIGQRTSRIENRLFQAGILLDAAHIRHGKPVQFIPEELLVQQGGPAIQPDISWQLTKPD